jgi:hypothetical protein
MPLLRLLPLRFLLVLGAGVSLAFCGRGMGLWSSEGTQALPADSVTPPRTGEHIETVVQAAAAETKAAETVRVADADRRGARDARDRDIAERVEQIVRCVQRGEFHAAIAAMERSGVAHDERCSSMLRARTDALGWQPLVGDAQDSPPPAVEWTLKGRTVRIALDAVPSRVLSQDASGATLRMVGSQGVTFPKVATHLLEPDSVRGDEAAELGLLAYAASDIRAARVWCAIAFAKNTTPSQRAQQLKALLP